MWSISVKVVEETLSHCAPLHQNAGVRGKGESEGIMETAVLRLGLVGFDASEQVAIREVAAMHRAIHWL